MQRCGFTGPWRCGQSAATADPSIIVAGRTNPPRDVPSPPARTLPEATCPMALKISYTNNDLGRGTGSCARPSVGALPAGKQAPYQLARPAGPRNLPREADTRAPGKGSGG